MRKNGYIKVSPRCAAKETGCKGVVEYVCHHCGKPLCTNEYCSWVLTESPEFSRYTDEIFRDNLSVHCLECLLNNHGKKSWFGLGKLVPTDKKLKERYKKLMRYMKRRKK